MKFFLGFNTTFNSAKESLHATCDNYLFFKKIHCWDGRVQSLQDDVEAENVLFISKMSETGVEFGRWV